MDWLERLERRKLIRKLARRMLWKDIKALVFSWRVFFLIFTVVGYLLFPYFASVDNVNMGLFVYITMLCLVMLGIEPEPIFCFLPMTKEEIRQCITDRMVLLLGGITVLSVGTAALLKFAGISVYLERGAMSTLALLDVTELIMMTYLYDNREKAKEEKSCGKAKARKVRSICYLVFGTVAWCYQIIAVMFMERIGSVNDKVLLLRGAFCFAIIGLFYADLIRWTDFTKFRKKKPWVIFGRSYSSENQKEGAAS